MQVGKLLISLCLALRLVESRHIQRHEMFIVPILWHGPNNQVTEIKEALSLSHLVPGSITVVPNLSEHKFSDGAVNPMHSKELFNFQTLTRAGAHYILLDDLRKNWNGELDVIIFFRDEKFPGVSRFGHPTRRFFCSPAAAH
jgi:hypothetical protein